MLQESASVSLLSIIICLKAIGTVLEQGGARPHSLSYISESILKSSSLSWQLCLCVGDSAGHQLGVPPYSFLLRGLQPESGSQREEGTGEVPFFIFSLKSRLVLRRAGPSGRISVCVVAISCTKHSHRRRQGMQLGGEVRRTITLAGDDQVWSCKTRQQMSDRVT